MRRLVPLLGVALAIAALLLVVDGTGGTRTVARPRPATTAPGEASPVAEPAREGRRDVEPADAATSSRTAATPVDVPAGVVHGVVVDTLGAPVSGVGLRLAKEPGDVRTASDEAGRFRFPAPSGTSAIALTTRAHLPIEVRSPRPEADGSWSPARIVVARTAALRVVLRDGAGEPIAGRRVDVRFSTAERHGDDAAPGVHRAGIDTRGGISTRSDGTVALPRVWAEHALALGVAGFREPFERMTVEGDVARALVVGGVPIALEAGETLELHVVVPSWFRAGGEVLEANGSPVPEARVSAHGLAASSPSNPEEAFTRADGHGRFRIELICGAGTERVLLRASDREKLVGGHSARTLGAAVVELSPGDAPFDDVRLVLEPTGTISGRIESVAGEPVQASVRVVPSAGSRDTLPAELLVRKSIPSRPDGEFAVSGLLPGSYDVTATRAGWTDSTQRDVETGSDDVRLVLEELPPVRVTVDAVSDAPLDEVIVVSAALLPHGAPPPDAARLVSTTVRASRGWPFARRRLDPSLEEFGKLASIHTTTPYGTAFGLPRRVELPHSFELKAVHGWIGVRARTKSGHETFPVGTGLVRFEPGDHYLVFHLVPASRVEGRVLGAPLRHTLRAGIATSGELLELEVRRALAQRTAGVGALGTFEFPLVPAGRHELWIGTEAELEAGRPLLRRAFEARDGEPVRLDVEL